MAQAPIYNEDVLPCLSFPFSNTQEQTTKYLGGKARTGRVIGDVKISAEDDAGIKALYEFWKQQCNYGLEPFLMPIPVFGEDVDTVHPAILVKFLGELTAEKAVRGWDCPFKIEILGDVHYVVTDAGDYVLSDSDTLVCSETVLCLETLGTGDYIINDDGDFVATGNNVNSYKEILWEQ